MKSFILHPTGVLCIAVFTGAFLSASCARDPDPQDPALSLVFTYRDVTEADLQGIWIITERSLERLMGFSGVTKYTNRLDHLILLQDRNRCAYRTFENYFPFRDSEEEDRRYRMMETNEILSRKVHSWYAWHPGGDILFDGPFCSREEVVMGRAIQNRWPCWSLIDLRKAKGKSEGNRHWGERYHLRFSEYPSELGPSSGTFWHLGEYDNRLRLWTWISPNSRVIFEKVTDWDIDVLMEKRYGRITNTVQRYNGSQ